MSVTLKPSQAVLLPLRLATKGAAVLVVDDDDSFRAVVVDRIGRLGAYVHQAASVREAIEVLEREHIDLIVCDYKMPETTGTSLLAYVSRRGFPGNFVLMSASLPPEIAAEARRWEARTIEKWDLLDLL